MPEIITSGKTDDKSLSRRLLSSRENTSDNTGQKINQYTVFLVEDDPDDRRQATQILRKSPYIYNIHCFDNGDKLIQHFICEGYYSAHLMRHIPTLIMLDIHMPGSNGLDILKSLKEHPLTQNIPIIILTGDTSHETALNAYRAQANAFIAKPLNLDHVHEVIYTGWGWPGAKS